MMRRSAEQMPSIEIVKKALAEAGLQNVTVEPYSVTPVLEDMFLYSGKHRPDLYLDSEFRAGISSFAKLSQESEIESGLSRLSHDITSGEIANVIRSADYDGGDYSFVLACR